MVRVSCVCLPSVKFDFKVSRFMLQLISLKILNCHSPIRPLPLPHWQALRCCRQRCYKYSWDRRLMPTFREWWSTARIHPTIPDQIMWRVTLNRILLSVINTRLELINNTHDFTEKYLFFQSTFFTILINNNQRNRFKVVWIELIEWH